jgi:hypothetical protein
LNGQIDPVQKRFRIAQRFEIVPRPGVSNPTHFEQLTALMNPDGPFAIMEFTGALPRAKLYTNWQLSTNDTATLETLGSAKFQPAQTVFVDTPIPGPSDTNVAPGTVTFTSYKPKEVVLKAQATAPSVLLLNDRFAPNWFVEVDGQRAELLRCNYLMRGVRVPPGEHTIGFRFAPPIDALYVSLAAIVVGLGLIGFLAVTRNSQQEPAEKKSAPGA